MARGTRKVNLGKRNKGLSSTFQPPEEDRSVQRPKRCDKHSNKDEDNSLKNVNIQPFYLIIFWQASNYWFESFVSHHHHHVTLSRHTSLSSIAFGRSCRAISCIGTELLHVGSSRPSCPYSSIWRGSLEYITYELVPPSPAVSNVFGSSNFDSFRDGW